MFKTYWEHFSGKKLYENLFSPIDHIKTFCKHFFHKHFVSLRYAFIRGNSFCPLQIFLNETLYVKQLYIYIEWNLTLIIVWFYKNDYLFFFWHRKCCVKSVRIRSYFGPYFHAFGLNTESISPYSVRMR